MFKILQIVEMDFNHRTRTTTTTNNASMFFFSCATETISCQKSVKLIYCMWCVVAAAQCASIHNISFINHRQ